MHGGTEMIEYYHEARCSAYVEMEGGVPDQFVLSF